MRKIIGILVAMAAAGVVRAEDQTLTIGKVASVLESELLEPSGTVTSTGYKVEGKREVSARVNLSGAIPVGGHIEWHWLWDFTDDEDTAYPAPVIDTSSNTPRSFSYDGPRFGLKTAVPGGATRAYLRGVSATQVGVTVDVSMRGR